MKEKYELAHRAGVGAALIDSLPDENVLVMSWIEAETLHVADIQSQPAIAKNCAALRKLHQARH